MVGSYGLTFKFAPMPVCTGEMQDGNFTNPQHRNDIPNVKHRFERCIGVEPKQEFAHWRLTVPIRGSCAQTLCERETAQEYRSNLIESKEI